MENKSPFFTPIDEILFQTRVVQVSGPVGSELAYQINRQLLALEKADSTKPIFMFIDSPGGEINSGFSIFDMTRFIKPEVYTIVAGLAASMGSLIALCAKKQNRVAFPNSKFLIHQPLLGGTYYGSASDLDIRAKDILKTRERINKLYAEETGKPLAVIQEATDRDNWMNAEEARQFGLIDRIVHNHDEILGKK